MVPRSSSNWRHRQLCCTSVACVICNTWKLVKRFDIHVFGCMTYWSRVCQEGVACIRLSQTALHLMTSQPQPPRCFHQPGLPEAAKHIWSVAVTAGLRGLPTQGAHLTRHTFIQMLSVFGHDQHPDALPWPRLPRAQLYRQYMLIISTTWVKLSTGSNNHCNAWMNSTQGHA